MLPAPLPAVPPADLFAGWPDWLVGVVGIAAVIVAGWILIKLLKLALWLALATGLAVIVVAGVIWLLG